MHFLCALAPLPGIISFFAAAGRIVFYRLGPAIDPVMGHRAGHEPIERYPALDEKAPRMSVELWSFENALMARGYASIAGVDEAGRGPLAGPVVSAAVILPPTFISPGINDSKQLSQRQRERLFDQIQAEAVAVGIGLVDAAEIDRINIFQAARRSMAIAVANLAIQPDYLLIDGKFGIASNLPQDPIIKGDSRSISIAAASIIAKVTRDRLMLGYHEQYPQYGFDRHKGYPTKVHKAAVAQHGPSAIHRRTFRGVKEHLAVQAGAMQPVAHDR